MAQQVIDPVSLSPPMPSSTVENYLKAIHHLSADVEGPVAVGQIASELQVTPGTVTTMMKHLGGRGLVTYTPRRGVRRPRTWST